MKLPWVVLSVLMLAASAFGQSNYADPCSGKYASFSSFPNGVAAATALGFKRAVLATDNDPPVCVTLSSVQNKKVEILIETDGDRRICVRDVRNKVSASSPPMVDQCGRGRVRACFPAETNRDQLNLRFYCDEDCETSDVSFYFKINVSNVRWTDNQTDSVKNLEMWCMMQDSLVHYPSDDTVPFGPQDYVYTSPRELPSSASLASPLHAAAAFVLAFLVAWAVAL